MVVYCQNVTHLPPPLPWCVRCVRGKARQSPHTRISWEQRAVKAPIAMIDVAYLKDSLEVITGPTTAADALTAVLVGVGERTRYPLSLVVEETECAKQFLRDAVVNV